MSARENVIELPHCFELYIPTQCRCGKPLPSAEREDILTDATQKMSGWFGGANIRKVRSETIRGYWTLKSGALAEELIDVLISFATEEDFEAHREDFSAYAAELANRLTQEGILCRVNNKSFTYPSTQDPKPHRCAWGSAPVKLPEPLSADDSARYKVLQAALQRIADLNDARDLFCNILHYEYTNEILPTRDWPDSVKQYLAPGTAPQIIADQNGFKIIYLQLADANLRKAHERQIVQRILQDLPDLRGLVAVSDVTQKQWNLVNVKFTADKKKKTGVILRRMRVGREQPVRTAVERLLQVDVEAVGEDATAAQLQEAHDRAFDVEAVSKQFFNDVANWYFWALKHAEFPKAAPKEDDGHDHVSLIRLITRLIFCWFLREKRLMPDGLFDRRKLQEILTGFTPEKVSNKDSVYYRAILQNLFFATLNTETDKRAWVKDDQHFMAHSLYRFKECFQKPGSAMELFKSVPFLNGGLFECLDKDLGEGAKPRYLRIDGFSRRSDSQCTVPDFLFFGPEREVDLSKEYGDKKFKKVAVRGLIDTLCRYNFTIEENTPIEQEVALDPELCGKVFENLLAAYNPETNATARKQTGSFYTPREIVNYMVDEALIASLKTKLEAALPAAKEVESRLRQLFSYDKTENPFVSAETDALIAAVDTLKTLDPAVGSGAFPMGLLHKLVFVLGKLDPDNAKWSERQRQRAVQETDAAFKLGDREERQRRLEDINEVFEQNASDYGRKLYLIENCIYGVDIQAIAVQIAKMRFFISLIVDQKIDDKQPNRGVRPLPNLETKFVAANSLIGIDRPGQQLLRNLDIDKKEAELRRVRERHFLARTPKQKAKCRDEDARLRAEIARLLKDDGWDKETATKLASWDPYDQNASAAFFDAEWMFGIVDGFDILIGNPPYVRPHKLSDDFKRELWKRFTTFEKKADLYVCFIEKGVALLKNGGGFAHIVSNGCLRLDSFELLRKFLLKQTSIRTIVDFDEDVFDSAAVKTCILLLKKTPIPDNQVQVAIASSALEVESLDLRMILQDKFSHNYKSIFDLSSGNAFDAIKAKMKKDSAPLGNTFDVSFGLKTGDDNKFLSTTATTKQHRRLLRGEDIGRYTAKFKGEYVWYVPEKMRAHRQTARPGSSERFEQPKVLIRDTGGGLMGTFDGDDYYVKDVLIVSHSSQSAGLLKKISGILNSTPMRFFYNTSFPTLHVQRNELASLPIKPELSKIGCCESIPGLVDRILVTKRKNPAADTSGLEREIDQQVYALYGLTPEEIKIVEDATK